MCRTCNTHDGQVMNANFWFGNLKETDSLEELGVEGRRNTVCLNYSDGSYGLLGYYVASSVNSLPTFRFNMSGPTFKGQEIQVLLGLLDP
jgi:hypothetical protein